MVDVVNAETLKQRSAQFPEFGPGDSVRVWCKIVERDRTRLTPFEGIVVRRRGRGVSETFIVRRVTHGEGVERVFAIHAPVLERIELLQRAKPKRARLYYLRTKIGKTRIEAAEPGPLRASAHAPTADQRRGSTSESSAEQPAKQPSAT